MTQAGTGSSSEQRQLRNLGARDWAAFQERQNVPLFNAVLTAARVGSGTRLLDVGCGAGLAAHMAHGLGATVTGLDAAEGFIEIARERTPDGDFRVGEMESLPFDDASFDVVTGFNSFQFAANPLNALREAARVVRADGVVAIAIWGKLEDNESMGVQATVAAHLPPLPTAGPGALALSGEGVLMDLVAQAGLRPEASDEVKYSFEYPDLATAVRAGSTSAASARAARLLGEKRFREIVEGAFKAFEQPDGHIRLANTMAYVVGRK